MSFVHADDMVENDESLFSITSVMLCWVNVAMNGSQNKKMVTVNQTQAKKVSLHIVTKTFPIFDFSIYREKGWEKRFDASIDRIRHEVSFPPYQPIYGIAFVDGDVTEWCRRAFMNNARNVFMTGVDRIFAVDWENFSQRFVVDLKKLKLHFIARISLTKAWKTFNNHKSDADKFIFIKKTNEDLKSSIKRTLVCESSKF